MPIPPALAARLAKRGLMKDASVQGFDPATGYLSNRHSFFFHFPMDVAFTEPFCTHSVF